MGTPYLDELVRRLQLRPDVANLQLTHVGNQQVAELERHRLSLKPVEAITVQQMLGLQRAFEGTVTRTTGGPEAAQRGIAAISAALTHDVIGELCRELVPECIPNGRWFNSLSMKETHLREILCRLIVARMLTGNESDEYLHAQQRLQAALR